MSRDEATPQIAGYELIKEIGRGGMGFVYLAECFKTGDRVALKVVRNVGPLATQSFRGEIAILEQMDHPHVVRVIDHGVAEGRPWYAMELLNGTTLDKQLEVVRQNVSDHADTLDPLDSLAMLSDLGRSPAVSEVISATADTVIKHPRNTLPTQVDTTGQIHGDPRSDLSGALRLTTRDHSNPTWKETQHIWRWIGEIAQAICHSHGQGIVHCDLKPGNIFVTEDKRAVLMDFGLSIQGQDRVSGVSLDSIGLGAGTARYMSPEQARGDQLDARSDLYSLGTIMYEAAVGQAPFPYADPSIAILAQLNEPPQPIGERVDGFPKELEELTMRLLAKNPADRPGHAHTVVHTLASLGIKTGIPTTNQSGWRLYHSSLQGRQSLMRTLDSSLQAVRSGGFSRVFLGGEGGVGKSRLVLEVIRKARRLKVTTLRSQCHTHPLGHRSTSEFQIPLHAFAPTIQYLVDFAHYKGAETTERIFGPRGAILAPYFPAIRTLPGQDKNEDPVPLDPQSARVRVFRSLLETVLAYSRNHPLVWVFEDLHSADELTQEALQYLMRNMTGTSIFMLGTFRSDENTGLWDSLAEIPGVDVHLVPRLGSENIPRIVREMLGSASVHKALEAYIERHSDGNPYFVSECLRTAIAEGVLTLNTRGKWDFDSTQADDLEDAPLPERLAGLIRRRIERLNPEQRRVCEIASVLGQRFSVELLERVSTGHGTPDLGLILEQLRRRAVLSIIPNNGFYCFVHEELVSTFYARQSDKDRSALHRATARELQIDRDKGYTIDVASLAWHHEASGQIAAARQSYLEAFHLSIERYAHKKAIELYLSAKRLTKAEDRQSLAARVAFANLLRGQGQIAEAETEILEALSLSSSETFAVERARLMHAHGALLGGAGKRTQSMAALGSAMQISEEVGDRAFDAKILGTIGRVHQAQGQYKEAIAVFRRAVEAARAVDDRKEVGRYLGNIGLIHFEQGRRDEALGLFLVSLEAAKATKDKAGEAIRLGNLGLVYAAQRQLDQAEDAYRSALRISREIGDRRSEGRHLGNLALLYLSRGNEPNAWNMQSRALAIAREMGAGRDTGVALANLGKICLLQNRVDEAISNLEEALSLARHIRDGQLLGYCLLYLGRALRLTGDIDNARSCQDEAQATLANAGLDEALAECNCERAHLRLHSGQNWEEDLEKARTLVKQVSPQRGSDLAAAIDTLERAVEAQSQGIVLHHGESPVQPTQSFGLTKDETQ